MIKYLFPIFAILCLACGQQNSHTVIVADEQLTSDEQKAFIYQIIRYIGKLPGKADHITKFEERFDEHYKNLTQQHDLVFYHTNKDTIYFGITRIAPSIHIKKVCFAGKLMKDDKGISYYNEVFRTWKMSEEELLEKSEMLFRKMIAGADLSPWYIEQSQPEEFIEFPNSETYFDTEKRLWISTREDPLEEYYHLKKEKEATMKEMQMESIR